jgi:signal transduction histidine kinase
LYGFENVIATVGGVLRRTQNRWDVCVDADIPSISIGELQEAYHDARERGVKIRYMTEITKDNLHYCNEMMKFAELRHFAGLNGSFAVSNEEYVAGIKGDSTDRLSHCIYSNVKQMVRHQGIVFDVLWQNAVAAEARVRELEEGISLSVMEIIQHSRDSLERVYSKVKSAKEDVLIMFSTPNAMRRQLRRVGAQVLTEAEGRGARLRILVPGDEQILDTIAGMKSVIPQLEIRSMEKSLRTSITTVIVDRKESFIFETKNDDAENAYLAVGYSLYSNNATTAQSFASIFESIWNQTELYEKLRAVDSLKEEFIGIAAHELRNPVLPIILAAEGLLEELGPANSKLRIIVRNTKRLNGLIGTILDITRIEGKTFRLQKERTNIARLVEEAVQDAAATMQECKGGAVQIHSDISPDIEQDMVCDKERIRQVLANLLDNAVKFTERGTITVNVGKSAKYPGHREITITDTGRGIDESIKDRLFEKFMTKSEKLKGTGLGLYLSKAIVEAHGGKIWAENNKGSQGATFTFTIPYEN